ncbi:MAG TPA: Mur ligase domain-containing protein, partial [Bdellovibrio sp.]|nr:Mur ligase domain-containing protein [Bdellovibrio sp.]
MASYYTDFMNLQHLFSALPGVPENVFTHLEVTGLFNDARKVIPNSVFVAIRGLKTDGHQFINDAIQKEALALVVEDKSLVPATFEGITLQVPNTREALDL